MDNKKISPFSINSGEAVYKSACDTVEKYGMRSKLERGVLVGLSGGADSVLLLHFLLEYRKRNFFFPIVAVHINHCIRGDEADRDEKFSSDLASDLGVEFISVRVDVPSLARNLSMGIEEAARKARYSEFSKIISGREDISVIAVAHNATDNLETVLFNIMRGAGTRGAAGIPPVRDNIIRPLIHISKPDVCKLLDCSGIEYVIDSTNLETDYTRNFLRHNVIEELREVFANPEASASRLSEHLRSDDEFISSQADVFLKARSVIYSSELLSLHDAVFARVVKRMAGDNSSSVEQTHIVAIRQHLSGGDFSISLPGKIRFISERGECRVVPDFPRDVRCDTIDVSSPVTELVGYDADFIVSDAKIEEISRNVYKISIQANLSSAIIDGGLYIRFKRDGDSIFYGGHTHKLKKVFNDFKIPLSKRNLIPLLCDSKGIVWVPGLAVRDDSPPSTERRNIYVAFGVGKGNALSEKRIHLLSEFRINTQNKENNI